MKLLVVIAIAIVSSQAAPADDIQNAVSKSKIPGSLDNAFKTAEHDVKPVMNQYEGANSDIHQAIKTFPATELEKAVQSSSSKINKYVDSLQNLLNDPHSSPEDKAHQAVSNLSPLLEGILADFTSSSNNIENYLKTYSNKANTYAENFKQSANQMNSDAQQWANEFNQAAKPEIDHAYNSVQSGFRAQESDMAGQMKPAVQDAQNKVNDFMASHFN